MKNPYDYVVDFEKALADFTSAPYVVCMESCSAALFLCCQHEKADLTAPVHFPNHTYPSAPNAVIHAGGKVLFDREMSGWQAFGGYRMYPTRIFDCAKRIARSMYVDIYKNHNVMPLICLSFHAKKTLPIGRGGAILCGHKKEAEWFRCMRHDGRNHGTELPNDKLLGPGWNFLMAPEQAARGLTLMSHLKDVNICDPDPYQDLSKYEWYK